MRKNIISVLFCVLVLVFVAVAINTVFINANSFDASAITLYVDANGGTEKIQFWKNEDKYYAFLPSYVELSRVYFQINTSQTICIGDIEIRTGMNCENYELNKAYSFICDSRFWDSESTITFLCSKNVAAMYIDTQSGSMDYIHSQKGNEEQGSVRLFTDKGEINYSGQLESVKGRGNNTWESFEKKPYSIKLVEEANLLGLGYAHKWILLANADDPSHMRNKIVYEFAEKVGLAYSPDSQWVDLYLNGEYAGLYLLCERNELYKDRINISREGSFIVSLERADRLISQNYAYVETNEKQALRIHYPFNEQKNGFRWIEEIWQSIENAILSENGIDEVSGKTLWELIDLDSWVKKYLVEEIFASGDACFISQFFYLDGGEENAKVYAGPVWDFDHSLGTRVAWALVEPKTMYANRLHVKDGFDRPWFHTLYHNETFFNQIVSVYTKEYLPVLEQFLHYDIPNYSKIIEQSAELNRIRWSVESEGMLAEQAEIQNFLSGRIDFLNSIWLQKREYHLVKIDQGFGGFYGYYAVYTGEYLQNIPEFEDTEYQTFCGWYYKDSNEPFDISRPITEDIEIYAKWQDKPSKKMEQILKLVPLGVIAMFGVVLLSLDIRKSRRR